MAHITDVVIIGSGAIGCAAAYYLTHAGVRRVTVVEKGPLVSGMTRRSAGLVHAFQANETATQLAASSLKIFRQWAAQLGPTGGLVESGIVVTAKSKVAANNLRERVEWQRRAGVDARLVDAHELGTMFPALSFDSIALASFDPTGGYADSIQTAQAFAQRARERGAIFETGTLVKSIAQQHGRATQVVTTTGTIEAPTIIVAAGAWSDRLLTPLGISLNLHLARGVIGFFQQPISLQDSHPILLSQDTSGFIRPHAFHLSAAGITNPNTRVKSPDMLDEDLTHGETGALADLAAQWLPSLNGATLKRAHSILYDQPPDGRAALGSVPGDEGVWVAAGFGENTFALAPAVGQTLAELIVDRRASIDVDSFALSRATLLNPPTV